MKYKKCEICGLHSERKDGIKRCFMARFPLDEVRCKEWVKMTGNEDLAYIPIEKFNQLKFVCGKHFEDKDFNKNKTRLKKTAVPSIRLTVKPLLDEILIGFPCHIFKEQRAPYPDVPLICAVPENLMCNWKGHTFILIAIGRVIHLF